MTQGHPARPGAAACQCGQREATLEFIRLSAAACVGDAGPAWTHDSAVQQLRAEPGGRREKNVIR